MNHLKPRNQTIKRWAIWGSSTAAVVLGVGFIGFEVLVDRPLGRLREMHDPNLELSEAEVRGRLHAVFRFPIYGEHDAFLTAQYAGDWSTVPLLIGCLRWQEHTEPGEPMICTKAHCLSSLRAITGHYVGTNFADWSEWWRTTGQHLPPENKAPTMNLIEAISRSDSSYRRELEEIPPDDPVELMKALCGANRESEVFFHLADNKEIADVLVDQWGTPFRIARGEKQQLLLSSAGHDTVFETDDDLPPKRPNNKD